MIEVRRKDEIYHKEGGWFAAKWHFSFDDYYDPRSTGDKTCHKCGGDPAGLGAGF